MSEWRDVEGRELLEFVRGKVVADVQHTGFDTTTVFADGSAVRCTALAGVRYSSMSEDSPTVEWEIRFA